MRSIIAHGLALALVAGLAAPSWADEGRMGMGGMGGPTMPGKGGDDQGDHHGNQHHEPRLLLAFGSMYGVDGPFVGDANPIRDVIGDETPWTVAKSARG
ncbi:MAG TPA: hypothetical protein VEI82_09125, partial [Myxococcota bacterium]|nr:hypothetical protein [Myxococcota bacterium]